MATSKTPSRSRKTVTQADANAIVNELASTPKIVESAAEAEARKKNEAKVLEAASTLDANEVLNGVTALSVIIQQALGDVSYRFNSKIEELNSLAIAIHLKKGELEELGKKDIISTALDTLVLEFKEKKAQLGNEFDLLTKEFAEKKANLEKERKREQEEYNYNLQTSRRTEKDNYAREQDDLKRKDSLEHEKMLRDWETRENALKASETELAELKKKVEAFPAELESAKVEAAAAAEKAAKKSCDFEVTILKKTYEGEKALAAQTIDSLRKSNLEKDELVKNLQEKLEAAQSRTQSIAEKTVEAHAGRDVAKAVQEMAANTSTQPTGRK